MLARVVSSPRVHEPRSLLFAAVFAGGLLGALARTILAQSDPVAGGALPWPTLLANVAGAGLLGYAEARLLAHPGRTTYPWRFLATGVCGALTTFSTFQVELLRLAGDGHPGLAIGYGALSIGTCFAALVAARGATHRIRRRSA